mgnify:CR=1 FL=1
MSGAGKDKSYRLIRAKFINHMTMRIPRAILISTPTDLILTWAIHMSGSGKIKVPDVYVLSLPPYEHEYSPGNTHIYAHGPHSYLGSTDKVPVRVPWWFRQGF